MPRIVKHKWSKFWSHSKSI